MDVFKCKCGKQFSWREGVALCRENNHGKGSERNLISKTEPVAKLHCSDGLDLLDSLREALNEMERQHNEDEEGVNGWQIGLAQSILTGLEHKLRKQD